MKKKILIGSIFAVLLMLSMPVISNIQAQQTSVTVPKNKDNECVICPGKSDEEPCDKPILCLIARLYFLRTEPLSWTILPPWLLKRVVYHFVFEWDVDNNCDECFPK